MIKNTFMEKLEKQNSAGKNRKVSNEQPLPSEENSIFDTTSIEAILKSKMRSSIYDIKEEDFHRVKSIR